MEPRINFVGKGEGAIKAMLHLGAYLAKSSIEQSLLDLIDIRVSQINGCAYCLDMHSKDARASGETEQRLYLLSAWREAPFYTDRERAALAWSEEVTKLDGGQVSDEVFHQAREQFSEDELIDLTLAVASINSWNRLNIAFRNTAGSYQTTRRAAQAKVV